jgi:hypothetical protein
MFPSTDKKLHSEIANELNGTKWSRCRIGWKALATGYKSHGDWHDLSQEKMLNAHADNANQRYAGEIEHWIEYE